MLTSALIYLLAAVVAVPLAKRIGLGSVLGYLLAGVLIGPNVLQLVGDQTEVMHFAEFGVVMMLFLIGLELRPGRLWEMRRPIIGLGGLQVLLTAAAITAVLCLLSPLPWQASLAIGLALALSSTAIVVQSLQERGLLKTQAGSNAFSVLLFQDIAVIPILALLPLLSLSDNSGTVHDGNLIHTFPVWMQVLVSLTTIAGIVVGGHYLAAPVFRYIAETHLRELFTAFALLIVIAIAVLMLSVGLSPALGSFLAGVVLAESEFRHELEVDIEPFKGLLLGLFFITVGANTDFPLLLQEPLLITAAVFGLVALKGVILGSLALLFHLPWRQGLLFTLALAQGGEFAFVLVSAALQFTVFDSDTADLVIVVVALSMLVSPLLLVAYEAFFGRRGQKADGGPADSFEETADVIIAGYGRFGQIIGRLLGAQGYNLTILDHSPGQVEMVRRFGNKVYYGDAARRDLLEAAGAADAKLLVVAVDEPDKTLAIIDTARTNFPHLKILARAIDRRHAYELKRRGIAGFRRETFDSALHLGVDALKQMGVPESEAEYAGTLFDAHDAQTLEVLSELWGDDRSYGVAMRQRMEDLKQVLTADRESGSRESFIADLKEARERSAD